MILSILILISSNPIIILIVILAQTLFICLLIWTIIKTRWFSFILFLIFLGGLIVLFVYVVSLASNEKFELKYEETYRWAIISTFIIILFTISLYFNKIAENVNINLYNQTLIIFSDEIIIIITLVIAYLLFTLIIAVKISSKYEGPLRNFI